jgi:DNA polymerase I
MRFSIPPEVNSWDRHEAAQYYHTELGWAVHALCPPDKGPDGERGKKPIAKGWRSHTAAEVTPQYLSEHFSNGSNFNLGVVVRSPFLHVDLDSKPDGGQSVRDWLASQRELYLVPRERTGGGAHLVFICRDLPHCVLTSKKALSSKINEAVTAELYTEGMNIVVSPSLHKGGTRYEWEVKGGIPEVSWQDLQRWFAFQEPDAKKRGRPQKEKPWWSQFKGALHTLDAVALFREAGLLGGCIEPDEGKWSVTCPWEREHTEPGKARESDTVIFSSASTDDLPGFKCLHAHCADRTLKDVIQALEAASPGIVDRHCAQMRVWEPGALAGDGRPRVVLPQMNRPDSEFAIEMGSHIGPRNTWFNKTGRVVSVSLRRFSEKISALGFAPIEPVEACTAAEQFVETGVIHCDKESGDKIFAPHSMSRECAAKMLASTQFRRQLPDIIRILDIQLPVMLPGGDIVFPASGYDPRFQSYLDPEAPPVRPMPFEKAVGLLREMLSEFGWKNAQSLVHALARIITPFCRGLMGWDARFPLWHFSGNRPRTGKDYLAGLPQIIFEGRTCEDAPLERESEETRKRITAALMAGRRTMHFANCQGHIQDAALIGAVTSKTFAARNLGSTEARADLTLPNELEFSLSANVGLTFREDVEPRTRRIDLVLFQDNPNGRPFRRPNLHEWVMAMRSEMMSAIAALVKRWIDAGCPSGPTPFNSFPEWSRVVGGIMNACNLGDPCLPHEEDGGVGGDLRERAMRALYRIGRENYPEGWVEKGDLFKIIALADDEDLGFFGGFDGENAHKTKTRIGKTIGQYAGRELSGTVMEVNPSSKGERQLIRFIAAEAPQASTGRIAEAVFGGLGSLGTFVTASEAGKNNSIDRKNKKKRIKNGTISSRDECSQSSRRYTLSTTGSFAEIASKIEAAASVALDIETYGTGKKDALNPWRGDIRLLSLAVPGSDPWLIDLQSTGYELGALGEILESVEIIAHNAKFDLLWLAKKCAIRPTRLFCTLTAARLLSAGTKPGNNLDQCLQRYLGIAPGTDLATSDWGGMLLTPDQFAYAARDVAHLHRLKEKLAHEINHAGLDQVCALEMALCPEVVAMECAGIAVDAAMLQQMRDVAQEMASGAAGRVRDLLKSPALNPSSPDQLKSALNRQGIAVPNTSEAVIKAADEGKIIPAILEMRASEKVAQQAQSLLACIENDGRIHGRFEPTGTDTGRFASKSPNLQNVARGELRECFVAPGNRVLVVADYSQIELRAAAAIAGETRMLEAYEKGEDLHQRTAAAVLGKPPGNVTKEDRQLAKAVNFGLLYGQSAKGLVRYAATAYGVELSEKNAYEIRSAFFRSYGYLRQWHGESRITAERGIAEVRTRLGRRRLIAEDADAWERFTALVNTPVQGACADGMKRAIVLLASRLPASAQIVSTVHDEVIVECNEQDASETCLVVEAAMKEAMAEIFPEVPIVVEAKACGRWGAK